MTERQKRFADEYIISGNAYKSALLAGYSDKYAKTDSHKLLENTRIKKYIDERLSILEKKKIATQDEVLQYLTSVMRGEHTEQTLRALGEGYQEITDINVGAKDRIKAAYILNKVHQARINKESAGNIDVQPIIIVDEWSKEND